MRESYILTYKKGYYLPQAVFEKMDEIVMLLCKNVKNLTKAPMFIIMMMTTNILLLSLT